MTTATVTAIPFYKSPQTIGLVTTFISAAIALFPKAGQLLGLAAPGAVESAVTGIFGAIAVIAPIVGAIVRTKSTVQPITLTQAAADVHPVTVAAQEAHLSTLSGAIHADPAGPIANQQTTAHPVPIPGKPWGK
jgi:hypothetical protein